MKTVLILYNKDAASNSGLGAEGFEDLYSYAKNKDILFCRAPIASFNEKTNLFNQVQFFDEEWFFKKNIKPDLVYDKTPFYMEKDLIKKRELISKHCVFYNDLKLSELLSNKWLTYKAFKRFSPKAFLISGKKDLWKIKRLSSAKIILKPLAESGGKGIKIFSKNNFKPLEYPFIVQELIEVKKGIKGFAIGAHDLRIMVINERPFYSYLRIPKKNSLISNLSQGGKIKVIPFENLPKTVFPVIKKIQKKLKKYKIKLYSIDMILDDNRTPWIIEMNSRPGIILARGELKYRKYFFDALINFFKITK